MCKIYINEHLKDCGNAVYTSFEINVKGIGFDINENRIYEETGMSCVDDLQEYYDFNYETGAYTNDYANDCFVEIKNNLKFIKLTDWFFMGRMAGWFVLSSNEEYYDVDDLILEDENEKDLFETDMATIQFIVDKYIKGYTKHLEDCIIDDINADLERELEEKRCVVSLYHTKNDENVDNWNFDSRDDAIKYANSIDLDSGFYIEVRYTKDVMDGIGNYILHRVKE